MTQQETYHYYALLYSNILLWERMYFLNEDGLLDPVGYWDDVSRQIDQRVAAKTFQRWFKAVRADYYNEEWQNFIQSRIDAANAKRRAAALRRLPPKARRSNLPLDQAKVAAVDAEFRAAQAGRPAWNSDI